MKETKLCNIKLSLVEHSAMRLPKVTVAYEKLDDKEEINAANFILCTIFISFYNQFQSLLKKIGPVDFFSNKDALKEFFNDSEKLVLITLLSELKEDFTVASKEVVIEELREEALVRLDKLKTLHEFLTKVL